MTCQVCDCPIDADRAEFLELTHATPTCVQHSQTRAKVVLMEYGHKTAGQAIVLPDDPEQQRLARRAYHRSR